MELTTLERLGFRPDDAAAVLDGLDRLTAADLAEVERLEGLLRSNIGRVERRFNPVEGPSVEHRLGTDFPLLIALIRVAPGVQAELVRRGLDDETAWRSVADLGQQVHVYRLVHGRFGFGGRPWVPTNFSGSLVWLGRLQYTLEPDDLALGVHIPESGPLTPELVDESLELARRIALPAYGEFEISRFTCVSWLLDPGVNARLPETSNVARFAARFEPYGEPGDGTRDALYFGFHRETRNGETVELDDLPQTSSLQRAIVAQLRDGGVTIQPGELPLDGSRR